MEKEGNKTKEQLLTEVNQLKSRITKLEKAEIESKKVKEALIDIEKKHRLIGENVEAIVWEFNIPENRWTYLSPQVKRILGFSPDEFTDLQFWVDHIDLRDRDWASSYCATCTGKGESHEFEYRFLKKDGSFVWLRDIVQVEMTNNQPTLMRGLMIDISERKQTEMALIETENKFKILLENNEEINYIIDNSGTFLLSEGKGLLKIGLKPGQVVGQSAFELYKDFPDTLTEIKKALAGEIISSESKHGDIYFRNQFTPYKNQKGDILGIVGLSVNITEIKEAEQALKESEEKFRLVIENSADMVTLHDSDGRYLFYSGPQKYGINPSDVIGKTPYDFFEKDVAAKISKQIKETAKTGEHKKIEIYVNWQGEMTWFEENIYPIKKEGNIVSVVKICSEINERKSQEIEIIKAKEKAEENENKFRTVFENSNTMQLLIEPGTGQIIDANQAACDFYGYEYSELISMNIQSLNQLSEEEIKTKMREAKLLKRSYFEFRHKLANGTIKDVEVYSNPIIIDNRSVLISIIHDISERKQAEQELKNVFAETKKLETIINRGPAVAFLWRAEENWPVEYVSENIKQFGYTPEDFLSGKVLFSKIIHPDDIDRVSAEVSDYSQNGLSEFIQEYRIITKLGDVKWINDHTWIRRDSNNTITHYQGIIVDITERKQKDEQIRKLSRAVEQSPATVVITDLNGDIEYVNPKFCETTGYSVEEAMSKNPRILKSGEKPSEEYKELWKTITSGKEWRGEFHNKRKNGELYWEFASISPIRNENGMITHYLAIKEEITERKKAEDELKENEARLLELNATKDKFFSIIGHDLKNPFNAILGFSGILMDQMKENNYDRIEEFASYIHESSKRAMDLLLNLLEWARSQTGKMEFNPEYADIAALINETTQLLNDSARQKAITISSALPVKTNVFVDKAMVSTILRNLISNAVKFTNPGGEIVVSAELKQNELLVAVKDKGVGIGKNNLEKLFRIEESYSTTGTNNEKGTGLGLILCKEFIEKHKGKIWAESEEGVGSQFYFTIPYRTVKSKILENNEVDLET